MKEIVVCSGKGGTGKTTVTAGLAALAAGLSATSVSSPLILADCDVDAADLHLVTAPRQEHAETFTGGHEARILPELCAACGHCAELCRFDAIAPVPDQEAFAVTPLLCEGCGVCVRFCPSQAIAFPPRETGRWFRSATRFGPMVHARLHPGGENSGKLVTMVRREARRLAEEQGTDLLLVDGPPGIGCPVTAAITGADLVLAVTEPGVSAHHDLRRLLDLTRHFQVPAVVCINKADVNPDLTREMTEECRTAGVPVVGHLPYDPAMIKAQLAGRSVVEEADNPAATALRQVWQAIQGELS